MLAEERGCWQENMEGVAAAGEGPKKRGEAVAPEVEVEGAAVQGMGAGRHGRQ